MITRRIEQALAESWLQMEPPDDGGMREKKEHFAYVYSSILGEFPDPSKASQGLHSLPDLYPVLRDFPLINLGAGRYTIHAGNAELISFGAPSIIAIDPKNIDQDSEIGPVRLVVADIRDFYASFRGTGNVFISRLDSFVFGYYFELSEEERKKRDNYLQECCQQILHHLPIHGIIILRESNVFEIFLDQDDTLKKSEFSRNPRVVIYQKS